jgi:hypothetical protein
MLRLSIPYAALPLRQFLTSTLSPRMRRAVDRAAIKLRRSVELLEYRRINWRVETNHRIRWEFETFVRNAREAGFPLGLHVREYDTPNEGVVQITVAPLPTGTVTRKYGIDHNGEFVSDASVIETGGELIASQSASGYVHFIAHPRRSERIKPKEDELILLGPLEPTEVTVGIVQKALTRYLLILQSSLILGAEDALTIRERIHLLWIRFHDLRSRYRLYVSLLTLNNEWGKAVIAGVVAFLVGYVTGSKT